MVTVFGGTGGVGCIDLFIDEQKRGVVVKEKAGRTRRTSTPIFLYGIIYVLALCVALCLGVVYADLNKKSGTLRGVFVYSVFTDALL